MVNRRGLVVAFTRLRGFFIVVWSITLLLEHLLMFFLFLEGAWSDTFDFCFHWIISRCPKWIIGGTGVSVAPLNHWVSQARLIGASLVFPFLHSVEFLCLVFLNWSLASSSLGVFGHTFLECLWPSSVRFLSALWVMSWWPLSSSLPPNIFSLLAWGSAFVRILFLVPPKVAINHLLPL